MPIQHGKVEAFVTLRDVHNMTETETFLSFNVAWTEPEQTAIDTGGFFLAVMLNHDTTRVSRFRVAGSEWSTMDEVIRRFDAQDQAKEN